MISDERLDRILGLNDCYSPEEMKEMAKEILAYRQAFSEPYAYEVKGILCHTLEEAEIYVGKPDPLFTKPTIPE
ncbi:hypothetical protein [Pantoea sp. AG702]|uniref:hypothetical protein n=1 Tax=Pantoea sp. AG702 TaxID=2183907 RepID=UPI000D7145BC|nr:hypothetical protein [Pantoea sp. AG702]PWW13654.1 hypothetical protein DFO57_106248 [Pantoea sp. AG702]